MENLLLFSERMNWRISKCVHYKIISSYDTFFDLGVKFDMFGFCHFWRCFFSKNTYLENGIFKICFRQSAKCKMTAQTRRKYHVFVKNCHLHCILQSKHRFSSSDHFFVFSVQLIQFTGGMFPVCIIYIQYILYNRSNISNRSNWFKKLRKLRLNDVNMYSKLQKLTLNDVNRYGKLRKLTVNYISRYGKLRKQVVRKRQNSRRGFR